MKVMKWVLWLQLAGWLAVPGLASAADRVARAASLPVELDRPSGPVTAGGELYFFRPLLRISIETARASGGWTPLTLHLGWLDIACRMDAGGRLLVGDLPAPRRGDPPLALEWARATLRMGDAHVPFEIVARGEQRTRLALDCSGLEGWLRLMVNERRAILQIGGWRLLLGLAEPDFAGGGRRALCLAGPGLSGLVPLPDSVPGRAATGNRFAASGQQLFRVPWRSDDRPRREARQR